ncbi:hypothetical protein HP532_04875 [Pseudomonas sp. CrR25]|nr:hypothetical protein [Pseudomonas sp. CrR25]
MKHLARGQHGAALVVSLIILLLLTVLAISASNTSSLQERMAFNAQENNIAFQTAESGLASAVTTAMSTCSASTSPSIESVTYTSGRTTRSLVTVVYSELDSDLTVAAGAPILGRYDISSRASIDPDATTASAIEANTHALHRQGYRCLGFN